MAQARRVESWERPAEELVRLLRDLLGTHWTAISTAIAPTTGHDQAEAHLRQLEDLTRALEAELWAKGQDPGDRKVVKWIGKGVSAAVLGLLARGGYHVADEIHKAITDVDSQAAAVVVEVDVEEERGQVDEIRNRIRVAQMLLQQAEAV